MVAQTKREAVGCGRTGSRLGGDLEGLSKKHGGKGLDGGEIRLGGGDRTVSQDRD